MKLIFLGFAVVLEALATVDEFTGFDIDLVNVMIIWPRRRLAQQVSTRHNEPSNKKAG